jgi:O-antigen ligase
LLGAAITIVSWGVLAFGAVYPWAYIPLLMGCTLMGGVSLWMRGPVLGKPLIICFSLVALCVAAQLIPIPLRLISTFSPQRSRILSQLNLAYATGAVGQIPLSIAPESTLLGLVFFAALAVWLLGLVRRFGVMGVGGFARALLAVGFIVALIGIVQGTSSTGKIYGFWQPMFEARPFGPFVNPNHFAGWMLMALPVGLGYFFGLAAAGARQWGDDWHHRLLWLSSASASQSLLAGFAVVVMSLSLVLSLSRSGLFAFCFMLAMFSGVALRRRVGIAARTLALSYLALVMVASVGWVGMDAITHQFATAYGWQFGGRLAIWRDALRVIKDFPIIGTGFNTYGTAMLLYQSSGPAVHYREAHSDYLQLLAEGGVVLGLAVFCCVVVFARDVRSRFAPGIDDELNYWIRVGAVIGLLAISLQEVVEFSLQMPGNAVLFAGLAAMAIHSPGVSKTPR